MGATAVYVQSEKCLEQNGAKENTEDLVIVLILTNLFDINKSSTM